MQSISLYYSFPFNTTLFISSKHSSQKNHSSVSCGVHNLLSTLLHRELGDVICQYRSIRNLIRIVVHLGTAGQYCNRKNVGFMTLCNTLAIYHDMFEGPCAFYYKHYDRVVNLSQRQIVIFTEPLTTWFSGYLDYSSSILTSLRQKNGYMIINPTSL